MPLTLPTAILISGASSGVAGGLSNIFATNASNQNSIAMQKMQNNFNEHMWNLNNEYNDPKNQMARLVGAGISPTAAAQALTGGNSNAPVVASNAQATPYQGIGEMFGGIAQNIANLANVNADTRVKNAEANRNELTLVYDLKKARLEVSKFYEELGLTREQKILAKTINKYADGMEKAKLDQIKQNYDYVQKQMDMLNQQQKKAVWENFFRDNFGIDPNSSMMQNLVTSSLSGKIGPVWNAFEKTIEAAFAKAKSFFDDDKNTVWPWEDGYKEHMIKWSNDFSKQVINKSLQEYLNHK